MVRCPICKKEFKKVGPLLIHIRRFHGVVNPYERFCPLCGPIDTGLAVHCLIRAELDDLDHALLYLAVKPRTKTPGSKERSRVSRIVRRLLKTRT